MFCDDLGDGVLQRFDAFARHCGDGIDGKLPALGVGGQLFELVRVGDIGLGGDKDSGPLAQRGVKAVQLGRDDLEVLDRVGPGRAV
jgi:hypothetical protein